MKIKTKYWDCWIREAPEESYTEKGEEKKGWIIQCRNYQGKTIELKRDKVVAHDIEDTIKSNNLTILTLTHEIKKIY